MSTEGVGDRDRAVSQQVSHGLDVYSRLKRGHGGTMAQRVHPDVGHARFLRRDLNRPQDVARVDRRAELGGEHRPVVLPLVTATDRPVAATGVSRDVAMRISHESIYRDLYMPSRKVFDASMFHRLRTDRPIRRPLGKRSSYGRGQIRNTVSIRERPVAADTREVVGHRERLTRASTRRCAGLARSG
jgi:IS30 family transposase